MCPIQFIYVNFLLIVILFPSSSHSHCLGTAEAWVIIGHHACAVNYASCFRIKFIYYHCSDY